MKAWQNSAEAREEFNMDRDGSNGSAAKISAGAVLGLAILSLSALRREKNDAEERSWQTNFGKLVAEEEFQ